MTRKNVVMVYADDLVWDYLQGMPYLASEPEGSWVTFPQGTHSTPLCGPSRSTLLTGLYATTHGNSNNEIGNLFPDGGWDPNLMFAPALMRAGVRSAFLGKYINGYPWPGQPTDYRPPGWGWWRATQGTSYTDFPIVRDTGGRDVLTGVYRIDVESDEAVAFVETTPEPFNLVWSSFAPHTGGDADEFMPAPRHTDAPMTLTRRPNFNEPDPGFQTKPAWKRAERPTSLGAGLIAAWDGFHVDALRILLSLDEGLQRLVAALKARGILENTVIIFLGDNANCFGEHRHWAKGVPWEEATMMCLRIRWPGHPGGVNDALVSNIDLAPTLLDLAGARLPYAPDGMSMVPLLEGRLDADHYRDELFLARDEEPNLEDHSGGPSFRGVRTRTHKYVEYRDSGAGQVELYDLVADPYELTNLAGITGHAAVQADLARKLAVIEQQLG